MIPRTMHRLISIVICLSLCFAMASGVLAYSGVSSWAKEDVDSAETLGILPASLQSKALSSPMTRLEMCHMAVNAFEKITGSSLYPAKLSHFSDTRDADVCVAYELGIVNGFTDGTFRPDNQITRQEFSKVAGNLLAALGWSEDAQTLGAFADETSIAGWAKEAVIQVVRLGVVTGDNNGRLNPNADVTYEQACVMFFRAYEALDAGNTSGSFGAAEPVDGAPGNAFTGLSPWAEETVTRMNMLGMLPASAAGAEMSKPITRADMCELAVRTYQMVTQSVPEPAAQAFPDTDRPEVSQAKALGIVNGFTDGTFHPDEALTRVQFFQITGNLLKACGYAEPSDAELLRKAYSDFSSIGAWAHASVATLYRMDVMHGDGKGNAQPLAQTSCEQAIAMLMRTLRQVTPWYQKHPLSQISGPMTSPNVALQVVELAKSLVGSPYVWAGASPTIGFDCSGLVYYVYKQFGYNLYRSGDSMANNGIAVKESDMQPGDIIIFANKNTGAIQHVGLFIGDGMMVHAQSSRTGVVISRYDYDNNKYIYTIRRVIY